MANVTFLFGNGFDINIGLKTSYRNFYDVYVNDTGGDSDNIKWFKSLLQDDKCNGWEKWADFELGMGEQSVEFKNDSDKYIECITDFQNDFILYLKNINSSINWGVDLTKNSILNSFSHTILDMPNRLKSFDRTTIKSFIKKIGTGGSLNMLSLNYTNALSTLYRKSVQGMRQSSNEFGITNFNDKVFYLHGTTELYPIIGVDNETQIKNEFLRKNRIIRQHFIKSEKLKYLQGLDPNIQIDSNSAFTIIKNSHIIFIFGVSIGDTDERWWKAIGEWLKGEKLLIIFAITGEKDHPTDIEKQIKHQLKRESVTEDIFNRFTRLSGWTPEEVKSHKHKIHVELDNYENIFNLQLPIKPSSEKNHLDNPPDTSTALATN